METEINERSRKNRVLMLDRKYNVAVIGEPTDHVAGEIRLLAKATYIHRVDHIIPAIGKGGGYVMMSAIKSIVAVAYGIDDLWERWS